MRAGSDGVDPSPLRTPERPARRVIPAAIGVRLFASTSDEPRVRRPTDVMLLVVTLVALGVLVLVGTNASNGETILRDLFAQAPGIFDGVWRVLHDLALVWAFGLILLAAVARGRMGLVGELMLAMAGALLCAAIAYRIVEGAWPSLGDQLTGSGGPPTFPALRLAVASAVIVAASPHLGRPLRRAGRWILLGAALSTMFLGVAILGGVLGGLLVGTLVAAIVHVTFGSPGGRPSLRQVQQSLAQLGVAAADLQPADLQPAGVWTVLATGPGQVPLTVKVYGRDAWDGHLAMSAWRALWYRNTGVSFTTSRLQQVEHEAFLTLLAAAGGVAVPKVLAAGRSRAGDALLALSTDAVPLGQVADPSDGLIEDVWSSLARAHDLGISPGQLDPIRVGSDPQGRAVLLDWVGGQTAPSPEQMLQDRAQLLVTSALLTDDRRAVAVASAALGAEGFTELIPYLQAASLSPALRRMVRERDHDLSALRALAADQASVELPQLVKLRRVTWGSVLQALLLVLAGTAIVAGITSLDWDSVSDEVRGMSVALVIVALAGAQLARASGAMSIIGASPAVLPVGPVVQLQFAIAYINMAVPSTAGRLAMVMRFYQRVGSTATTALGASALDSFANFIVQVLLILVILLFGLGTLDLSLSSASSDLPPNLGRLIVVVVVVMVVAAAISMFIPRVRNKVMPTIRQFRDGLRVLRSPAKVVLLFLGNTTTQVLYSLTLGICVQATGNEVGLADLLLIINVVGTFASIIPVPNGMGVQEAGLTAGLVAAGIPESPAFAAVIVYRLLTAYLSPIWGFVAMRSLQKQNYL